MYIYFIVFVSNPRIQNTSNQFRFNLDIKFCRRVAQPCCRFACACSDPVGGTRKWGEHLPGRSNVVRANLTDPTPDQVPREGRSCRAASVSPDRRIRAATRLGFQHTPSLCQAPRSGNPCGVCDNQTQETMQQVKCKSEGGVLCMAHECC